jgi:hypothetical protein
MKINRDMRNVGSNIIAVLSESAKRVSSSGHRLAAVTLEHY